MGYVQGWSRSGQGEVGEGEMSSVLCAWEERYRPYTLPVFMWSWEGGCSLDTIPGLWEGEQCGMGGII